MKPNVFELRAPISKVAMPVDGIMFWVDAGIIYTLWNLGADVGTGRSLDAHWTVCGLTWGVLLGSYRGLTGVLLGDHWTLTGFFWTLTGHVWGRRRYNP